MFKLVGQAEPVRVLTQARSVREPGSLRREWVKRWCASMRQPSLRSRRGTRRQPRSRRVFILPQQVPRSVNRLLMNNERVRRHPDMMMPSAHRVRQRDASSVPDPRHTKLCHRSVGRAMEYHAVRFINHHMGRHPAAFAREKPLQNFTLRSPEGVLKPRYTTRCARTYP